LKLIELLKISVKFYQNSILYKTCQLFYKKFKVNKMNSNEISKKYQGYGNNPKKLLDLKLLSCLSKFLNRQDVELWSQKILQNHYFLIEYLTLKGADPFAQTFQEQEKAIRFIINQINKKIILILQYADKCSV